MIQAAAYCRVSTDKEDQANSYESQQRYFREYIQRQPDWALYQVYADEGITGTSTQKRAAFNQMIQDAHKGSFQLILTKEVSRFSRNILDTIAYTRELRTLGVGVLFLNDGIDTREPDAELRLSIMGSLAQEESRRTSSRVKWGQTRRMEQGVVFGRSLLGYFVKDGSLTVDPEGAEIVKRIFHKYGVEKKGTTVIARELREEGFRTCRGNENWSSSHLVKILKNEKYVGELVQKKTITPDYLTHAKKYNHGEEALVILRDHHEPIISRELFDVVQAELRKRDRNGERGAGHSNRYVFSGKIKCGACGASFVSRTRRRKDGSTYRRWSCYTAVHEGRARQDLPGNWTGCSIGRSIREELAMEMVRQSIETLHVDWVDLAGSVVAAALEALQSTEQEAGVHHMALERELEQLRRKRESALDAFFAGEITKMEMRRMTQRYDGEAELLLKRLEDIRPQTQTDKEKAWLEEDMRQKIRTIVQGERTRDAFYKNLLDYMVVYPGQRVDVKLNLLPHIWTFALEEPRRSAQNDPSVPMSVSSPLASAKGME